MIVTLQGFTLDDLVRRQVRQRPNPARGTYAIHQFLRDAPAIKAFGALVRNGLQGVGEFGLLDDEAQIRDRAIGREKHLGRVGRLQHALASETNAALQSRIQGIAFAGQTDGRLQTDLQRQFAVLARQILEGRRLARDTRGQRARGRRIGNGIAGLIQIHVASGGAGRLFTRIQHGLVTVALTMQKVEPTASEPRAAGFHDRQRS